MTSKCMDFSIGFIVEGSRKCKLSDKNVRLKFSSYIHNFYFYHNNKKIRFNVSFCRSMYSFLFFPAEIFTFEQYVFWHGNDATCQCVIY